MSRTKNAHRCESKYTLGMKFGSWNILVLEIVPRLPQQQANTISKRNRIKLVFWGFGLKFHQQGGNKHSQANKELNHAQVR